MVVEILVDKGLPLSISENAVDNYGEKLSGWVAVSGTKEVDLMVRKVTSTPEFLAFFVATQRLELGPSDVHNCQWGEDVKRKVLALYWQNYAEDWRRWAATSDSKKRQLREMEARNAQAKSRELLGKGLTPLTTNEIHALLETVIVRNSYV